MTVQASEWSPSYLDPLREKLEAAATCRLQGQRQSTSTPTTTASITSASIWGTSEEEVGPSRILQSGPAPEDLKPHYMFAVVPKQFIEFFEPTKLGCIDHSARLSSKLEGTTVECLYIGPAEAADRGIVQAQIVQDMLWGSSDGEEEPLPIDGLAISVVDPDLMTPILRKAKDDLGIPVVTFDSDAPESGRAYYVGTNNSFFGRQLGRQMEALNPGGGTFAIISGESVNLQERHNGILKELVEQTASNPDSTWEQLDDSPFDALNNQTLALQKMDAWAEQNPTVLLSVTGLPMRIKTLEDGTVYAPWQEFVDKHKDRGITLLSADASPHQLKFLEYDYVNGLAGQLPYDMGIKSIDALWSLLGDPNADLGDNPGSDTIGTNVLWHIQIPLKLPKLEVETNRVGGLQYIGYTLFTIVALTALAFSAWALKYRRVRVVRVSQPNFLVMIAVGVIIMTACMIPLGLDDYDSGGLCHEDGELTEHAAHCRAICMSVPWLFSIGFTTTFSAMYAKTRRVNKLFRTQSAFTRIHVKEKDVMIPFFFLLTVNVTILTCWQAIDPLVYHRESTLARDEWNRVLATYGTCYSDNMVYFLVPLMLVNAGVLVMANWQAYEARNIESEFAETKSIAICMASLLQAVLSGVPVLFFVSDIPKAFYMVFVLLCFIVGMVILLVIFVPKIIFAYRFTLLSQSTQSRHMQSAIAKTAKAASSKDFSMQSQSEQDQNNFGPGRWTSHGWQSTGSQGYQNDLGSDVVSDDSAGSLNHDGGGVRRRASLRRSFVSDLAIINDEQEEYDEQEENKKEGGFDMPSETSDEGDMEDPTSAKAAALEYVKALEEESARAEKVLSKSLIRRKPDSVQTAATEEDADETENPHEEPQEGEERDNGDADLLEDEPREEEKKEDCAGVESSTAADIEANQTTDGQEEGRGEHVIEAGPQTTETSGGQENGNDTILQNSPQQPREGDEEPTVLGTNGPV
ncbi:acid type B receptor subunit 2 [Seminavis robusta]|uniref:Acid type B receptor subunit 2 n=1 Tax=Seminavis robusta TaxID=568900 RepID=A0A9N8DXZ8_9STRA|nr:acid type B receptor subunit 2 [Seminavis robusta]|eukprot:Sro453_g146160.1 acid type B receptor subunit 2 (972) ;mRNA; r:40355-43369